MNDHRLVAGPDLHDCVAHSVSKGTGMENLTGLLAPAYGVSMQFVHAVRAVIHTHDLPLPVVFHHEDD